MNLRKNVISDWKVKITSQSSIKVDGELLEKSDTGEMVSLKGSPISGNYSFITTILVIIITYLD